MISVIIGTHGMFSEEILKSAEMIFGNQENVGTVTFKPGEGVDNLVEKYKSQLDYYAKALQSRLFLVYARCQAGRRRRPFVQSG